MDEYDFLGLVNKVNQPLNEVPLIESNFLQAKGWYSQAKNSVNAAIQHINDMPVEWPFYWTEVTLPFVVNQSRYAFPSDFRKANMSTFRILGDESLSLKTKPLFNIDYEDYVANYSEMEVNPAQYSALPEVVFKTPGFGFGVAPAPDYAYSLKYEYYRIPAPLRNPLDVPVIPQAFQATIVNGAMFYAYLFREDEINAQIAQARFEDSLKAMQRAFVNRTEYVRSTYIRRR